MSLQIQDTSTKTFIQVQQRFLQIFELKGGCSERLHTLLTANIQVQLGSAAASLIEGVAPVGARVWPTNGRDGKQGGELVTPGTQQDVRWERLVGFLQSKQRHRA